MIPDGVTEGLFVIVSLAPVFIFQATLKNRLYKLIKTVHADSWKSPTTLKSLQHEPAVSCTPPCFAPHAGCLPGSPEATFSNFFTFRFSFSTCSGTYFHVLRCYAYGTVSWFIHVRLFVNVPWWTLPGLLLFRALKTVLPSVLLVDRDMGLFVANEIVRGGDEYHFWDRIPSRMLLWSVCSTTELGDLMFPMVWLAVSWLSPRMTIRSRTPLATHLRSVMWIRHELLLYCAT